MSQLHLSLDPQSFSLGLPEGWEIQKDSFGRPFFINHSNKSTTYEDPRKPLPSGWEIRYDNANRPYYVDHNNHLTTYCDPRLTHCEETSSVAPEYQKSPPQDHVLSYSHTIAEVDPPIGVPRPVQQQKVENKADAKTISVTVVEAHNLKAADINIIVPNSSDPYVKVFYIPKVPNFMSQTATTEIKAQRLSPVWHQTFDFDYSGNENDELYFEIWDKDRV